MKTSLFILYYKAPKKDDLFFVNVYNKKEEALFFKKEYEKSYKDFQYHVLTKYHYYNGDFDVDNGMVAYAVYPQFKYGLVNLNDIETGFGTFADYYDLYSDVYKKYDGNITSRQFLVNPVTIGTWVITPEQQKEIILKQWESEYINNIAPIETEDFFIRKHKEIYDYLNKNGFDFSTIYNDCDNIVKSYIIQKCILE